MSRRNWLVIVAAIVYLITGFAMISLGIPVFVVGLVGIGCVALSLVIEKRSGGHRH